MAYHFTQPCPTCGRHVRISISYLGRAVACQHCHAEFHAMDDADEQAVSSEVTVPLMDRVEAMLQQTSHRHEYSATATSLLH